MTEVLFYHLQNMTVENVLPPLLEKSLERGWRVVDVEHVPGRYRRDQRGRHIHGDGGGVLMSVKHPGSVKQVGSKGGVSNP